MTAEIARLTVKASWGRHLTGRDRHANFTLERAALGASYSALTGHRKPQRSACAPFDLMGGGSPSRCCAPAAFRSPRIGASPEKDPNEPSLRGPRRTTKSRCPCHSSDPKKTEPPPPVRTTPHQLSPAQLKPPQLGPRRLKPRRLKPRQLSPAPLSRARRALKTTHRQRPTAQPPSDKPNPEASHRRRRSR